MLVPRAWALTMSSRSRSSRRSVPHRRGRHDDAEACEFAVDGSVAPAWVLLGQPPHRRADAAVRTRAPGAFVAGLRGPAASDDVTVPAQDGLRRDNQTQASTVAFGNDVEQERDQCPVGPAHLGSGLDLALQHGELVA